MVSIYALKDDEEIFYIGKCKDVLKRKSSHIRASFAGKTEKDKRIQRIINEGRKVTLVVLKCVSADDGDAAEKEMIKRHTRLGRDLVNVAHNCDVRLTEIELQVITLMAEDIDTDQIALKLFRSVRTIETIRRHAKEKAKVQTIAGLMAWAYKKEILTL